MPTSPPTNPSEKIYKTPQPPENSVDRGGFDAPAVGGAPTYDKGRGQQRREVSAESMPAASEATGGARSVPNRDLSGGLGGVQSTRPAGGGKE